MAKAEKKVETETVVVSEEVTLTLSMEEAQCLRNMIGYIGGGESASGMGPHGGTVNSVYHALRPLTSLQQTPFEGCVVLKNEGI